MPRRICPVPGSSRISIHGAAIWGLTLGATTYRSGFPPRLPISSRALTLQPQICNFRFSLALFQLEYPSFFFPELPHVSSTSGCTGFFFLTFPICFLIDVTLAAWVC